MSSAAAIKIEGDASGFVAATEESKKAAVDMSNALKGAIGGGASEAVKGLKGMDQEGRKACRRLNAGLINTSATVSAVKEGINAVRAAWGKFSAVLLSGDDLQRVTARLKAFTGGAASAAGAAREVVEFADTPPFGLAETQRAAQLLLGVGVRASELKKTLEALGNVAAGGGASLEQMGIRLAKAYQTGRVTMEVLEPMMNSGINVMGELAQRTGKTRAELQKMMQTGGLGFKDLLGALVAMGSAGGQFEGAMAENTQDLGNRVETLKGKVSALGRTFAEPVSAGIKEAMESIEKSWSGSGPEVERGLKSMGELLGNFVKGAAPVVSAVGGALAKITGGTGLVETGLRRALQLWVAFKVYGMAAGSSVGQAVRAAAMALRVDYSNELRVAGGNMKRFDSAVRASGTAMKRAWQGVGSSLVSSLKGPAVMAGIAAITYAVGELYKVQRAASGAMSKDVQHTKRNFKRDNDDFDERIWKAAGSASSRKEAEAVIDEYDAEIKRLTRLEEDLSEDDPLGNWTMTVNERIWALKGEREELQRVAAASAKTAQARERNARMGQQTEEERKKTLEKIRDIESELLSIDYDRAEAERERRRSGLGLEDRKKDLLGSYGSAEGIRRAIDEQRAMLAGADAVDGVLNLEGVESKIKSLYELLGKVEEVDREIIERNKKWDKAEQQHRRQTEMLRAEITGEREKLRVLQEQARVLELQGQYESAGMSKARAGAAAQETANMERNRDREQAARDYRKNAALLKAQAEGNKAEERRLKMAERIKEIYEQQRNAGVDKKTALERAGYVTGMEDRIDRRKDGKGGGPIADSLAQVGGGGRSMMGSMPQLTEARTQTGLLRQLVRNTARAAQGGGHAAAVLGY